MLQLMVAPIQRLPQDGKEVHPWHLDTHTLIHPPDVISCISKWISRWRDGQCKYHKIISAIQYSRCSSNVIALLSLSLSLSLSGTFNLSFVVHDLFTTWVNVTDDLTFEVHGRTWKCVHFLYSLTLFIHGNHYSILEDNGKLYYTSLCINNSCFFSVIFCIGKSACLFVISIGKIMFSLEWCLRLNWLLIHAKVSNTYTLLLYLAGKTY